ncbi:hypothetical protein J437_LFUL018564 [Ladona fulva]|uniref:Uncharacterized protein n=1 Tax=Ladona fulva TaxID=123851 RepID=A0A8K0KPQ3_LADFU|nr:hypothetical protein J437_LFUL018564 [Ladona fulva]
MVAPSRPTNPRVAFLMGSLKFKVALITGASSGIGKGAALHFAKLGCRLLLSGRKVENLNLVAEECCNFGDNKVEVSIGDVSDYSYCEKLMKQAVDSFGKLDVLVNSAGILLTGGIEQLTLEDYNYQMNVNVTSIFSLTKLALPHLIETKGNIVNVSSVTGLRAFPGVVGYNISKAAVDHLTRSVALEAAPHGVRINAVNPGVIVTNLHKRGGMDEETYVKVTFTVHLS